MSDRLAVFDRGRIEQIGTPAEIYERPATAFIAGFVGVSNVLEGDLARRVTGAPEPCTIRPEKIRFVDGDQPAGDETAGAAGVIAAAVYLGAATRYTVALDGGGQLVVLQQNGDDGRPPLAAGGRVRLAWRRRHQQRLR
jgi:putative spermidine/putrescine transport system ATP-binding protein